MGLGQALARHAMTAASNPTRTTARPGTSSPAAAAPGPADPHNITPRTPGVISNNREAWPQAFGNARGDTFLTIAHFDGLDGAGIAKIRRPGNQPVSVMDIGVSNMPASKRQEIADDLARKCDRAPLLLQSKAIGGKPVFEPYEVISGTPSSLRVKPAIPSLDLKGEQKTIMDPKVFESAMRGLEKDIAALPLQRVLKIAPGQKSGDWLDSSVNSSIVQTLEGLRAKGYPYQMGAKSDLDGAMDCSGFVGAMTRRFAKNVNDSTGKRLFDKIPVGSAADMVSGAMKNGGGITPNDLLRNPRPGCLIGLDTGEKGWDRGRPLGIDHVALTFRDKDGKTRVAEYTPSKNGGSGLKVTDLEAFVGKYTAKGAKIYAATPEGMCNKQVLAQIQAETKKTADLGQHTEVVAENDQTMTPRA